ncbi:MAG: hypothetical protein WB630_22520, partial [Candidatus Acidiferrales bacterium]
FATSSRPSWSAWSCRNIALRRESLQDGVRLALTELVNAVGFDARKMQPLDLMQMSHGIEFDPVIFARKRAMVKGSGLSVLHESASLELVQSMPENERAALRDRVNATGPKPPPRAFVTTANAHPGKRRGASSQRTPANKNLNISKGGTKTGHFDFLKCLPTFSHPRKSNSEVNARQNRRLRAALVTA